MKPLYKGRFFAWYSDRQAVVLIFDFGYYQCSSDCYTNAVLGKSS